tara:strand:- start:56 stop:622 length:567 start_codon:yes stop_codon:yes gene_type:complete
MVYDLYKFKTTLPIFSKILDGHVELNRYLKETILEYRKKHPQSNISNVHAWHSDWDTNLLDTKFQPFCNLVANECSLVGEQYYGGKYTYNIENMWAMMYEEDDYTQQHVHFPCTFAVSYYIEVESKSSPILFVDNGGESLTICPKNGMLLIWPAFIPHMVLPTKGRRMGISMNLIPESVHKSSLQTNK